MNYIIEILGIISGLIYVLIGTTKYGLWKGITIAGGFVPTVVGGLVLILSILMIISKSKRNEKADPFEKKALIPVAAMVVILLCNLLVGLLPACMVVSFLWLRFIEKYSWKSSILSTAFLWIFIYLVFRLWLNVPFPTGLLGELL